MTWDPLLSDAWPTEWVPFNVEVRPVGDRLELVASGPLDAWTGSALLRNLVAVHEPSYAEVFLDLRHTSVVDGADGAIARCREFAEGHKMRFRVVMPPTASAPTPWLTTLPAAAG